MGDPGIKAPRVFHSGNLSRKLGIHRKIVKEYLDAREFPAYRAVKRISNQKIGTDTIY